MKKFSLFLATLGTLLFSGSVVLAQPAFAASVAPTAFASAASDAACDGIGLSGTKCGAKSSNGLKGVLSTVVNILSVVVGIAAVVMIIVSGLRYVTSGGESNKVAGAKNGLIYAVIGLVVVALSQFIVHFVLANVK